MARQLAMSSWLVVTCIGCGSSDSPSPDASVDPDAASDDAITDTRPRPRDSSTDAGPDATVDAFDDTADAIDAPESPTDCGGTATNLSALVANSIALDATHVYFTDGDGVKKVPRCGGTVTLLVPAETGGNELGIAVHGADVYFVSGAAMFGHSSVMRVPKAGGTPIPIATKLADPWPVAVDDEAIYWFDYGKTQKRLLSGGPVIDFPKSGYGYAGIALDSTRVFWSQPDIGGVAKAGGTPISLAAKTGWCVAADDAFVYWTTYRDDETVYKVSSAGGGTPVALATSHDQRCLAVDGDWVYWADDFLGVSRVRKSGGPSEVVGPGGATMIALDAYHVFWTSPSGVIRAPKPP